MRARALVGIVTTAAALLAGCSGQSPDAPTASATPSTSASDASPSPSPTPTPEALEVGGHRYLDACHLLPPADAQAIFGPLSGIGTVSQRRLTNTPGTSDPESSECEFRYRDDASRLIVVKVRNHRSAEDAAEAWEGTWSTGTGANRETIEAELARLPEYVANGTMTQERADAYRAFMEAAISTSQGTENREGVVALASLPGDILFRSTRGMFEKVVKNTVVVIDYEEDGLMGEFFGVERADPTNPRVVEIGAQVARAFALIDANAANDDLGQGAIPTDNGIATIGGTKVVEACAVLSEDIVEDVAGEAPWQEESSGLWSEVDRDLVDMNDLTILPKTECVRTWGDISAAWGYQEAIVSMAPDAATARAVFDQHSGSLAATTVSGADTAAMNEKYGRVYAVKGSYLVQTSIYASDADRNDLPTDVAKLTALTEAVLANIP